MFHVKLIYRFPWFETVKTGKMCLVPSNNKLSKIWYRNEQAMKIDASGRDACFQEKIRII